MPQAAIDKKDASVEAMRVSCAAAEGQLREAEALRVAEARARRVAERKVLARLSLPPADACMRTSHYCL